MRRFFGLAILAMACVASTDTVVIPHIIERNGIPIGVATGVSGGQRQAILTSLRHGALHRLSFFPAGNDALVHAIVEELCSPLTISNDWVVSREEKSKTLSQKLQAGAIVGVGVPPNSKGTKSTNPLYAEVGTKGENPFYESGNRAAGAKAKAWMVSNFAVSMGDLPTGGCSAIGALSLRVASVGDLDGDGREDLGLVMDELTIDIPWADSAPYFEWLNLAQRGIAKPVPLVYDLFDEEKPVLGVNAMVDLVSFGPANPTDPNIFSPAGPVMRATVGTSIQLSGSVRYREGGGL